MSPPLPLEALAEAEAVLDRAASVPRGLAFLHLAPLETVAITFSLDARRVERVRRLIDDPATHAGVIEAYKEAVARWKAGNGAGGPGGAEPAPPDPLPDPLPELSPLDLIHAAEEHPLGVPFLFDAPPESVAVIFGVTPFVVLEAREILEKRGLKHCTENGTQ